MDFIKMTNEQLKNFLDEHGVDHSQAKVKADLVQLAENVRADQSDEPMCDPTNVEEREVVEEVEQPTSLADKVKSAIKIERTETKKVDPVSYLKGRDYSQLTAHERTMIREESLEYESKAEGVEVVVTDRLPTKWRIVKLADKSYSKLLKGVKYALSKEDYEALKDHQVKVKTEATKNKCCGQARYESIDLLELTNG
ncbi:hypothetical protein [Enterococcus avium]|uniref:hypothetical protein n=1 Tax=Enterococcus avium TaxID=33945 RepID=UPI000F5107A1|nr:hypothetical protein [Enterococcus avium]MDT2491648.1 hypothetical protein [Enterococcus avium]ROZ34802.1 hypothetical protein EGX28_15860 [Enterococcus avium]